MTSGSGVGMQVTTEGIHALVRHLNENAASANASKRLRRELANAMRGALTPYAANAKSAVMALPARGTATPVRGTQHGLRREVAKKIRPVVYLTGQRTGAGIRAGRTPNYKRFAHSPKALEGKGWSHPVYGRGSMSQHSGRQQWFLDAVKPSADEGLRAVGEVMEEFALRIASGGPFE